MSGRVAICLIGRDQWEEYTLPAIQSIRRHEYHVPIMIYDIASNPKYPKNSKNEFCAICRINNPISYAYSMNLAIDGFKYFDWLLICNNDIICVEPFVEIVRGLDPIGLYGAQCQVRFKNDYAGTGFSFPYVNGWVTCLHRETHKRIGDWDENFEGVGGCEDLDYSIRARKALVPMWGLLPFEHRRDHLRKRTPEYREVQEKNRQYLIRKWRMK